MTTVAALCAGCGGLELGLPFDHTVTWVAETDPHASKVLDQRFRAPNLGDLTEIRNPPKVDVVTAGFPCQPVSYAGQRAGTTDERWLIDDIVRLARESEAQLLVLENVPGLLTANNGDAMAHVCAALAKARFDAEWLHCRASDIGAPHRRERWFAIAYTNDERCERVPENYGPHRSMDVERRNDTNGRGPNCFGKYAAGVERWERIIGRPAPEIVSTGRGRLNPRFVEWMMGLPDGWVTDIVDSRAQALRMLGNGVVPQQACHALSHLLHHTSTHRASSKDSTDLSSGPSTNRPYPAPIG